MRPSRREVLSLGAAAPLAARGKRPRIAAVCTTFFKYSHTQHIVDRFLEGYGWQGTHHRPAMDLVSLYVDQIGDNDLSRDRLKRFPQLTGYPTIAEALTRGTGKLAVDGVLLIAEHGKYLRNDRGQMLYPRYEFFQEIVKVFRASGRSVPVFNDKHLSWSWPYAKEMVDTARALRFPFMAGSSLPVTWRIPSVELPLGAKVKEALSLCYGGVDSYDYHGLESLQCMVERRRGGETGVKSVQAFRGEAFWKALRDGVWSRDLMVAAACRSLTLIAPPADEASWRLAAKNPVAYHYEHTDGLKSTMLLMSGVVQDFTCAARVEGRSEPLSTLFYLSMPPARSSLASFFSPLVHHIETLFTTGRAPYPIERTLLTTGLTAAGVESLFRKGEPVETPHLAQIRYKAPAASAYWRS